MLLADMLGLSADLLHVRLEPVTSESVRPGTLAEVTCRHLSLADPGQSVSLFLLHSPVPTSPDRFELNACRTFDGQAFDFRLGHVGVLIRPNFREPSVQDVDPFYRQIVAPPAPEHSEAVRSSFRNLYSFLIDVAVTSRSAEARTEVTVSRVWKSRRLLRLYQTRALVNTHVVERPWRGVCPPHSPAAYRPPAALRLPQLAGWQFLPARRLCTVLDALLPSSWTPYSVRPDNPTGFYSATGWLGLPQEDPPPGVEGSWLFGSATTPPAAEQPINWDQVLSGVIEPTNTTEDYINRNLDNLLSTFEVPAAVFRSTTTPEQTLPVTTLPRRPGLDELDLPFERAELGRPYPSVADPEPPEEPPEILGPPLPEYQSVEVTPIPEDMFETVSAALSRVLEGQAVVFPLVRFVLASDAGRTRTLTPTYPPPVFAMVTPFRGLALEES